LLLLLIIVNLFQFGSLLTFPLSQNNFRRFNSFCGSFWWSSLAWSLEHVCKLQVEIVEVKNGKSSSLSISKKQIPNLSMLILSNHQSLLDPLIVLIVAKRLGGLSRLKWFVKESLFYVPFLGWSLWLLDSIFLKRNWNQDENSIASHFKEILTSKDPVWLVSYPEGTRRSKKNILLSQMYAKLTNREPYRNVLIPRYKGFITNISGLGSRLDSILDFTIVYSSSGHSLMRLIWGDVGKVKVYFENIPEATLPQDPGHLKEWLFSRFRMKDELIEVAIRTKDGSISYGGGGATIDL
jgi:1-acyl-sn-glycerol-3-phosphate acyltransferase